MRAGQAGSLAPGFLSAWVVPAWAVPAWAVMPVMPVVSSSSVSRRPPPRARRPGGPLATEAVAAPFQPRLRDYFIILKPRVMVLVIFTALVGMSLASSLGSNLASGGFFLAPAHLISLFAIAVGAGASGGLNMWYERRLDGLMQRTQSRPLPQGRVSPESVLIFSSLLAGGSVLVLGLNAGWLAGGLLAFTILFYVLVYTVYLKPLTDQNIVLGGLAGAMPPLIGWAAVSGLDLWRPVSLVILIFMWTPPHFWALALTRQEDYARANLPMLPLTRGVRTAARHIFVYLVLLLPVSFLPYFAGLGGFLYGATSGVLGCVFVYLGWKLKRAVDRDLAWRAPALRLFFFSILYLFVLFLVLGFESLFFLLS